MILSHLLDSKQILDHVECTKTIWAISTKFQRLGIGYESISQLNSLLGILKFLYRLWKDIDCSQIGAESAYVVLMSKNRAITLLEQLHKSFQGQQVQLSEPLKLSEDDIRTTSPIIDGSWAAEWMEICENRACLSGAMYNRGCGAIGTRCARVLDVRL